MEFNSGFKVLRKLTYKKFSYGKFYPNTMASYCWTLITEDTHISYRAKNNKKQSAFHSIQY